MRKLFTTLLLAVSAGLAMGQTCIYHEDMDNIDSLTFAPAGNPGWAADPNYPYTGTQGALGTYGVGTSSTATSISFDATGLSFVILKFAQIAKIEFFDAAKIEVSTNNGASWIPLDATVGTGNCIYNGGSPGFISQGNKFTEAAYADWAPGQSIPPDPLWWKEEQFDVSALLGGQSQCMIRFVVSDLNNTGMGGRYGWLLDDICVLAAPCELIPPVITETTPLTGTIYNLGPFTVNVDVTDNSGVSQVLCLYQVDFSPPTYDTIVMTNTGANSWTGQIPAVDTVGRTVCYHFYAVDGSPCANPTSTFDNCFVTDDGVSPTYCDDFETNNIWTSFPVLGSVWELGTPAYGATSSTHSGVNAWDVDLLNAYQPSTEAYVISPVMDFSTTANTELSFWHNYNCENNWDGARIDYSVDQGVTWTVLGTFQENPTWYDLASIISSGLPAWTGNSGGWKEAHKTLFEPDFTYNTSQAIMFRFAFTSDPSVQYDGYSFDDFCLVKPADWDAGATAIVEPTPLGAAGDPSNVTITIKNFGLQIITSCDVYYKIDNNAPVGPFTFTGSLIPGTTANVACGTIIIPTGPYNVCAWTDLPSDANHFNDTTCQQCSGVPKVQITYCNDFDVNASDWTPIASSNGDTWELGTPAYGATNSSYSQPNCWDVNLFSAYQTSTNTHLYSPIFDMSTAVNARLTFRQNYNSYQFGDGMHIEYTVNGIAPPNPTLGTFQDPNGINWYNINTVNCSTTPGWAGNSNGWQYAELNLTPFNNAGLVQLDFVFCSSTFGFGDGHSIDNFCIIQPPPDDIGVLSVDLPSSNGLPGNSTQSVSVTIKNYGVNTATNFNVTYIDPLGVPFSQLYTGSLTSNATDVVAFTQPFTVPATGSFDICAYTELPSDGDFSNDTTCRSYVSIPTITLAFATCDDFENGNNGWSTESYLGNNKWELGLPAFGATNSAHSGSNAWDINLTTGYLPSDTAKLYTPYYDFTQAAQTVISLWINYNTEPSWDGVRMEWDSIGTSGTGAWQTVGSYGCTSCQNWYNYASLISSQKPGWAANSGGWIQAIDSTSLSSLDNTTAKVQFRFVFTDDASVQYDGFSIDDICFTVPTPITAQAVDVYPANKLLTPGPQQVWGKIANRGSQKLYSVVATLYVDGFSNIVSQDTLSFPLGLKYAEGNTFPFSNLWNASSGSHSLCLVTSYPNSTGDLDPSDDTVCTIVTCFDSTSLFPVCYNFESGPQWVTLNSFTYNPTQNSWQIGLPNKPNINSTHSGNNCWVTGLTSNYASPDSSSLFSPIFNVQQGKCYKLSFYHQYVTDTYNDGGTVEFSTDTTKSWHPLGYYGDPNWMSTFYIAAFGGPPPVSGWTGNSNGWQLAEHDIYGYQTGELMLRFRFSSDNSFALDGWAIDDACFEEQPASHPCTQGIETHPETYIWLEQNTPNPANNMTEIAYTLPKNGEMEMTLTNLMGQQVKTIYKGMQTNGSHSVSLNTGDLSNGIYYYQLKFDGKMMVRKMVIAR